MNVLLQKYRILGKKGEGTFSEVLKVQNIEDGSLRACKKMKQTYDSLEQVNNLREVQAMRRLAPHANVLELMEVIFDKKSGMLILICELMDMNIYEMIRGKKQFIPEAVCKKFMYQLVKALDHMHRNGIFHRDVKPENILVREDLLKLADFGSCRSVYSKQPYTEYISTRWYRAPECLLTDGHYTYKMDIWSVGCVFFEILSLHPLFPGSNEVDQIAKIHDIMGTPDPSVLNKLKKSRGLSFDFPTKKGSGIERLLIHVSHEAIELIYKMCAYDADERITARQALKHRYFKDLRDADKRAAAVAKKLKESQKLGERPPATSQVSTISGNSNTTKPVLVDTSGGVQNKTVSAEPHSPMKTLLPEIAVQSSLKSQSLPLPSQGVKDANKRVGGGAGGKVCLPKVDVFSSSDVDDNVEEKKRNKIKKRRHKQRQTETGFSHQPGFLPRVPMHTSTFNPTLQASAFSSNLPKISDTTISSLMPSISQAYKPHKGSVQQSSMGIKQYASTNNSLKPYQPAAAKPSKSFLSNYTLPSLDRRY